MDLQDRSLFSPGCLVQHFKRETVSAEELEKDPMLYLYEITGIAQDTETGRELMVYRALYGEGGLWVRPAEMWLEWVDREDYHGPRFQYVEE